MVELAEPVELAGLVATVVMARVKVQKMEMVVQEPFLPLRNP